MSGWFARLLYMSTEPDATFVRRLRVHAAFALLRALDLFVRGARWPLALILDTIIGGANRLAPLALRLRGDPIAWGPEDIERMRKETEARQLALHRGRRPASGKHHKGHAS